MAWIEQFEYIIIFFPTINTINIVKYTYLNPMRKYKQEIIIYGAFDDLFNIWCTVTIN